MSLEKAFFTSRGIGVIDVNYGGSTGYGRAYRELLRGQWGIVDVADAMNAALALAASGEADRSPARHQGRLGRRLDGPRRGDQRPRAHRALQGGVLGRDVLLRGVRPAAVRGRHPRLRVALPGRADRPAAGGGRAVRRAGAGRARHRADLPGAAAAGARRPDRAARRSPRRSRPTWPRTASRTPTSRSRASRTASARRRRSSPAWRRSSRSTARSSASPRRASRRSSSRSGPCGPRSRSRSSSRTDPASPRPVPFHVTRRRPRWSGWPRCARRCGWRRRGRARTGRSARRTPRR